MFLRRDRSTAALGSVPAGVVLESTLGGLVPRRFPGILAVAVDEAGPQLWSAGSWGTMAPVSAGDWSASGGEGVSGQEPVFQIGSVTKVFTAVLLAQMVACGDVELDAPVEAVLGTALRVGGRPVTFRHLVMHRSGLPKVPRGMRREVDTKDPYRTVDERRLLELVAAAGDRVSAGREAPIAYSNFGFAVLGLALGRCLDTTWEQALMLRVLEPVGLSTTGVRTGEPRAVLLDRHRRPVHPWQPAAFAPAGGLWMSARDLATWLLLLTEAVRRGAVPASAAGRDHVLEAVRRTLMPQAKSLSAHVGMAWHLIERDGVAWHNGGVLGAASFVGLDMRNGRAIGAFAVGNPRNALDRAVMRALTGR